METRRTFLVLGGSAVAVSSLPFAGWLVGDAKAATKLTRYDVTTAEGEEMLRIYARAVGKMMETSRTAPGSPRSWQFQWYTHAVPSSTSKAAEIRRLYSNDADPNKVLAGKMWNTCEAHFDSDRENFFLPWHRLYVMYLERIVRQVAGAQEFTLPYWNYTGANQADKILPRQFRLSHDPVWQPLFRSNRNSGVNDGLPVDSIEGALPLGSGALMSTSYEETEGDAGFCSNLDNNPHGGVHVDVGNSRGMGRVAWAANDPIFWLHHCNIDRMWASWNRAGGKNPESASFKNEPFTFADMNGHEVTGKVGDVLELDGLDYGYDSYVARPPGSPQFPATSKKEIVSFFSEDAATKRASGPVLLGDAATSVILGRESVAKGFTSKSMEAISVEGKVAAVDRVFYLRLNDVTASAEPGVGYDVYLSPSDPEKVSRSDPSYVGPLSFFGAGGHGEHGGSAPMPESSERTYSFVVTDRVTQLMEAGPVSGIPKVTLVPTGEPVAGAAPQIGSISLVSSSVEG